MMNGRGERMQSEMELLEEAEAVIELPQEPEEDEEDFQVMPYYNGFVGYAC